MADDTRAKLLDAFDRALQACDADARKFGIALGPSGVSFQYGAWIIPVVTNRAGGTSQELIRTLDRITELVETATGAVATVLLDPKGFLPDVAGPASAA